MEHCEQLALECASLRLRLWKKVITYGGIEEFHHHINGIRPSIQCTTQLESEGALPFLGRVRGMAVLTSVFTENLHTRIVISTLHPITQGMWNEDSLDAYLIGLKGSSWRIITRVRRESIGIKYWKPTVTPKHFINSATAPTMKSVQEEQGCVPKTTITIANVAGASEEIRGICRSFDVTIAIRTARTICSGLTKVTDLLPLENQSIMVYRVPCSCRWAYTGNTIWQLESRLKKHRDACSQAQLEKSAIAEHTWWIVSTKIMEWNDRIAL